MTPSKPLAAKASVFNGNFVNSNSTIESNSTATSDGGEQKLEDDVRHDSESIARLTTKICSQIDRK